MNFCFFQELVNQKEFEYKFVQRINKIVEASRLIPVWISVKKSKSTRVDFFTQYSFTIQKNDMYYFLSFELKTSDTIRYFYEKTNDKDVNIGNLGTCDLKSLQPIWRKFENDILGSDFTIWYYLKKIFTTLFKGRR